MIFALDCLLGDNIVTWGRRYGPTPDVHWQQILVLSLFLMVVNFSQFLGTITGTTCIYNYTSPISNILFASELTQTLFH